MSRVSLHLFATRLQRESRLAKEANYCLSQGIFSKIVVQGLWDEGLAEVEQPREGLEYRRLVPLARRLPRLPGPLRAALHLVTYLHYAFAAARLARRLRPSHVSCHNLMLLPIAWAACLLCGAVLVYVPHELETQRSGKSGLSLRLQALIERAFIRKARDVVVVCDPIAEWYCAAYGLDKVHVLRNLPERAAARIMPLPEPPFRQKFAIPDGAVLFIYQGLFGPGRGTRQLIDCFAGLSQEQVHIVFMGYGEGSGQAEVEEAARRHANIHFQPAVPMELITSYSAGADVGIFISEKASLSYRYALPNKFFEYAHAGLPILISDNLTYLAGLVETAGLGWVAPLEGLPDAITRIASAPRAPYQARARAYAETAVWEEDAKVLNWVYRLPVESR